MKTVIKLQSPTAHGQASASELIRLLLQATSDRVLIVDDQGTAIGAVSEQDVLGRLGALRVATNLRTFIEDASSEQWRFWNVRVLGLKAADFIPSPAPSFNRRGSGFA